MKRIVVLLLTCSLLFCVGCKKNESVSNTYRAYLEYHIANAENQHSIEALINSADNIWEGDMEITLVSTAATDAEAQSRFSNSVNAINMQKDIWMPLFEEEDYMLYTLKRTTGGDEKQLRQVKFYIEGHIIL